MIAGIRSARTTKVSSRTPAATAAPICTSPSSGSSVSVAKVPARTRPAPVTTAPVFSQGLEDPLAGAPLRSLLARPRHQEDVVVDPQRDEEDERHQHQVEGDPARPEEVGEGEGDEAERRRERGDHGGDQVGGRDQRPQHQTEDRRRRRAGPAARSAACRARLSARRRDSRPGCRRRSGARRDFRQLGADVLDAPRQRTRVGFSRRTIASTSLPSPAVAGSGSLTAGRSFSPS